MVQQNTRFRHLRLMLTGMLMLVGLGVFSPGMAAQDGVEPETTVVTVNVNLCIGVGCTELPEAVAPADGVRIDFSDDSTADGVGTGVDLGSCVTGDLEPGACAIEVPRIESLFVLLDATTVPEGFAVESNPLSLLLDASSGEPLTAPFLLFPVEPEPETTTLTTSILLCVAAGCTELPEAVEPADGIGLEISDTATGDVLGTCVTGDVAPGDCAIEIPFVDSVDVLIDERTVPEGYMAEPNPGQAMLDPESGEPQTASFLLLPVEQLPPDEPTVVPTEVLEEVEPTVVSTQAPEDTDQTVSALPDTGTGDGNGSAGLLLTASVLAMAVLGLAAIGVRRVVGRAEA
ncbi:hypothetical protein BH20CHL3_BH20CHL3_12040 [soil metagenome]